MDHLNIAEKELHTSKEKLKPLLLKKIENAAFIHLVNNVRKHSKINENNYINCEGAAYFKDERFSPDLANLLF